MSSWSLSRVAGRPGRAGPLKANSWPRVAYQASGQLIVISGPVGVRWPSHPRAPRRTSRPRCDPCSRDNALGGCHEDARAIAGCFAITFWSPEFRNSFPATQESRGAIYSPGVECGGSGGSLLMRHLVSRIRSRIALAKKRGGGFLHSTLRFNTFSDARRPGSPNPSPKPPRISSGSALSLEKLHFPNEIRLNTEPLYFGIDSGSVLHYKGET